MFNITIMWEYIPCCHIESNWGEQGKECIKVKWILQGFSHNPGLTLTQGHRQLYIVNYRQACDLLNSPALKSWTYTVVTISIFYHGVSKDDSRWLHHMTMRHVMKPDETWARFIQRMKTARCGWKLVNNRNATFVLCDRFTRSRIYF